MGSSTSSELYKALSYSTTEFDKNVLFTASGALGISMAFIDKIVKLSEATDTYLLMTSWYLFGGTIFLSLLTHFISIMANRWAIINCPQEDCSELEDTVYRKKANDWNYSIRSLNFSMIVALLLGIVFLIAFIQTNI